MIRTQVQLTEAQSRAVKRLAAERDVSIAEVIREAVDRYVGDDDIHARRRRAVSAIGGFRSGHRDVSARHDDYLTGDFG